MNKQRRKNLTRTIASLQMCLQNLDKIIDEENNACFNIPTAFIDLACKLGDNADIMTTARNNLEDIISDLEEVK